MGEVELSEFVHSGISKISKKQMVIWIEDFLAADCALPMTWSRPTEVLIGYHKQGPGLGRLHHAVLMARGIGQYVQGIAFIHDYKRKADRSILCLNHLLADWTLRFAAKKKSHDQSPQSAEPLTRHTLTAGWDVALIPCHGN